MNKKQNLYLSGIFLSVFVFIGCSSQKVIIDEKGVDMVQYRQDLKDCEKIADQVEIGKSAGKSALFGAVVSGGISAILGGDVGKSAAVGGVLGGAGGALEGDGEKSKVLKNCVRNRGYNILN